jgi:hypothetical protein
VSPARLGTAYGYPEYVCPSAHRDAKRGWTRTTCTAKSEGVNLTVTYAIDNATKQVGAVTMTMSLVSGAQPSVGQGAAVLDGLVNVVLGTSAGTTVKPWLASAVGHDGRIDVLDNSLLTSRVPLGPPGYELDIESPDYLTAP